MIKRFIIACVLVTICTTVVNASLRSRIATLRNRHTVQRLHVKEKVEQSTDNIDDQQRIRTKIKSTIIEHKANRSRCDGCGGCD